MGRGKKQARSNSDLTSEKKAIIKCLTNELKDLVTTIDSDRKTPNIKQKRSENNAWVQISGMTEQDVIKIGIKIGVVAQELLKETGIEDQKSANKLLEKCGIDDSNVRSRLLKDAEFPRKQASQDNSKGFLKDAKEAYNKLCDANIGDNIDLAQKVENQFRWELQTKLESAKLDISQTLTKGRKGTVEMMIKGFENPPTKKQSAAQAKAHTLNTKTKNHRKNQDSQHTMC